MNKEEFHYYNFLKLLLRGTNKRRIGWEGIEAGMGDMKNALKNFIEKKKTTWKTLWWES
jgi:hypothetical protein